MIIVYKRQTTLIWVLIHYTRMLWESVNRSTGWFISCVLDTSSLAMFYSSICSLPSSSEFYFLLTVSFMHMKLQDKYENMKIHVSLWHIIYVIKLYIQLIEYDMKKRLNVFTLSSFCSKENSKTISWTWIYRFSSFFIRKNMF